MDNHYLEQLISEANNRGGGMLLNLNSKPAAVVLTVDKYNELLNNTGMVSTQTATKSRASEKKANTQVLVTGGAGYIGSHLVRQLLAAGNKVTIIDNLSTGKRENVPAEATFLEGDLADVNLMRDLFAGSKFDAVFHMAASIEVEESVLQPEKYFENNVLNTAKLLLAMNEANVKKIIFSSSAAVYGEQQIVPINESAEPKPNNPYGANKLLGEQLIEYFCNSAGFTGIAFRYFNACGCDYDGAIAPTHHSHLIPIVLEVADAQRPQLLINGNDYETFDGTCVRDYVHVLDIAAAHVLALEKMENLSGFNIFNIGTGKGLSVLQIINTAAEILNRIIPMEMGPRRPGDAPATVADSRKIASVLGFHPQHSDINTIINTSWNQILKHKI